MNERVRVEREASPGAAATTIPTLRRPQHKRSVRWASGIIAAAVLVGVAGAYWMMRGEPVIRYVTASVTKGAVTRAVSGSGTVNPVLTIIVGTYVSGAIQSVTCDFNTRVKKGQLCDKIDPRPYQTLVTQAAANLATANAQLVRDRANLWLLVFALRWLGKARRLSVPDALAICFAQESGEIKLLSTGDTMVLAESAERPNLPPPRLPDERVAAARKAAQHMLKNFAANRGAPARSTANISLLLVAAVSPPESKK